MDTPFLITTILTIIFGLPPLIVWIRSIPSKIFFVIDENINLYQDVTKNIDDLHFMYKGNRISESSYIIKACFYYVGKNDITKDQINKNLYLEIPDGSKWYDSKIIETSKDVEVNLQQDGSRLVFDFDLLKNDDFFYFQSFVDINKDKKKRDIFEVGHRIANVGSVETISYKDKKSSAWPFYAFLLSLILTGTYMSFLIDMDKSKYTIFLKDKIFNESTFDQSWARLYAAGQQIEKNAEKGNLDEKILDAHTKKVNDFLKIKEDYGSASYAAKTATDSIYINSLKKAQWPSDIKKLKLNENFSVQILYGVEGISNSTIFGIVVALLITTILLVLIIERYKYKNIIKTITRIKHKL